MGDRRTSRTLVLLEDDPLQSQVLALQLGAEGLTPRCCSTTDEVLRQIAAARPGPLTLLMDIHVPQMQPLEFCRKVRSSWPKVRIVGCSASPLPPALGDAFDAFVLKPAGGAALAAAVRGDDVATPAPLNADTFASLAKSMSPALLRSLYAAYFTDADQRVDDMEQARASADFATLKRSAHTLKGSSGMLGVQAVAQCAFAMETVAGPSQPGLLLADLRQRIANARGVVNAKLDTLTADVAIVPNTTVSPTAVAPESKHTQ